MFCGFSGRGNIIQISFTLLLFNVFSLNTKKFHAFIWFQVFQSNITNLNVSPHHRLKELPPFLVAFQNRRTRDLRTWRDLLTRIFCYVHDNNLNGIKRIFESLQPEKRIDFLNSTVKGCLPLYFAVYTNRVEISRYLLGLSLVQGRRKMSEVWKNSRHPLIAAIITGNQELVKLILQNLYDINDNICGHMSPLMIATYLGSLKSVQNIVAMGAEIDRPCIHGRTPLMNSTSVNEICSFLISQGANVNHQDEEGFTALHLAVTEGLKPSTNNLLKAGADVKIRNHEGMNPLTWAAINQNLEEVYHLIRQPAYSVLDMIETLEILNACNVCSENITFLAWKMALLMRAIEGLPKNCQIPAQEILDFSQEFTTETELERIRDNPLRLAFQGILVIERILGRNSRLYIQVLLQTALIAAQRGKFLKLKQLVDYIQDYCQESSFVSLNFWYFKNLLNEIIQGCDLVFFFEYGGFTVFKIIAQATIKKWTVVKDHVYENPFLVDGLYSELVDTFLYMTSAIGFLFLAQPYVSQFKEEVNKLVKEDLRLLLHQSLLHRAVKLMKTHPWSLVDLLRVLLESGADVNAKDYFQQTPIMYVSQNVPEIFLNDVLTLFKEYGFDSWSEHIDDTE